MILNIRSSDCDKTPDGTDQTKRPSPPTPRYKSTSGSYKTYRLHASCRTRTARPREPPGSELLVRFKIAHLKKRRCAKFKCVRDATMPFGSSEVVKRLARE